MTPGYVLLLVVAVVVGIFVARIAAGKPRFGIRAANGALMVAAAFDEAARPSVLRAMRGFATKVLGHADVLEDEVAAAIESNGVANARLAEASERDEYKIEKIEARAHRRVAVREERIAERGDLMAANDHDSAALRTLADALK